MIFFNITRNVQCLRLCETGFKIDKLFCLKLSLYICLQYTLHTSSYVCTSRESLNVSSELCNMCLHFCKPPLCESKLSIVLFQLCSGVHVYDFVGHGECVQRNFIRFCLMKFT